MLRTGKNGYSSSMHKVCNAGTMEKSRILKTQLVLIILQNIKSIHYKHSIIIK